MKKLTSIIALSLFISITTKGQTRAETENWIREKLNSHSSSRMWKSKDYPITTSNYDNYKFKIENGLLIIEYDYQQRQTTSDPKVDKIFNHDSKEKLEIPISEIKGVKCEVTFDIETFDQSIKLYSNNVLQKDKVNIVYIGFNCFAEENLAERLKKAFNHLKTFYPRAKRKEAF